MKYKVGDKVTIRKDLEIDKVYYMEDRMECDAFVDDMAEFIGKEVTISDNAFKYCIQEDSSMYNWTDEMFESEE